MKRILLSLLPFLFSTSLIGQNIPEAELFEILRQQDSILFEQGYNQIDTAAVRQVTSRDFEMYHDQQGMLKGQDGIVMGIGSLAQMPFRARRELIAGSLQVYPMYARGELYGAVQMGEHRFWAKEEGKEAYETSTAKFISVWVKEEEGWKIRRSISYDHQAPNH